MSINVDSSLNSTQDILLNEHDETRSSTAGSRKASFAVNEKTQLRNKLGPAAQGPPATVRGVNDKWIQIQKNTFTNWINEQLKVDNENVLDLKRDFVDGVKLIKLINSLQAPNPKVSRRYFRHPRNQHESLENITLALNAITDDGIRLVNIGKKKYILNISLIHYFILYYTQTIEWLNFRNLNYT